VRSILGLLALVNGRSNLIEFTEGEVLELERAAFGASDTEGA
jgi:hypothetical protein